MFITWIYYVFTCSNFKKFEDTKSPSYLCSSSQEAKLCFWHSSRDTGMIISIYSFFIPFLKKKNLFV